MGMGYGRIGVEYVIGARDGDGVVCRHVCGHAGITFFGGRVGRPLNAVPSPAVQEHGSMVARICQPIV